MNFKKFTINRKSIFAALLAFAITIPSFAFDPMRWNEVGGGAWSPDTTTLIGLENELMRQIILRATKNHGRVPEWSAYRFQYQMRISELGKPFIYVNAFCEVPNGRLQLTKEWVQVSDGGACYFSAKYEFESGRLFDIEINGLG